MKTNRLFAHIDFPLATLLDQIELGQIGLPQIQRPFVWPNSKVRDLFDSMYHGYPVGYLLFWSNGLSGGHKQIGTDSKQMVPQILIVGAAAPHFSLPGHAVWRTGRNARCAQEADQALVLH